MRTSQLDPDDVGQGLGSVPNRIDERADPEVRSRRKRFGPFRVALIGLVLALVGLVVEVVSILPRDDGGEVVGVLRTLTDVHSNLTSGLAVWTSGTIVFGDGNKVRALQPDGTQWLVTEIPGPNEVRDIAATPDGPLYFTDDDGKVRQYFGGQVAVLLDHPITSEPRGIGVAADGTLFIADIGSDQVIARRTNGEVEVIGSLDMPNDIAVSAAGQVYVADSSGRVYSIEADNSFREVFSVEGARPRATRQLPGYLFITFAPNGDLVVADELANVVWRQRNTSVVRVLGNFTNVVSPDGAQASTAGVVSPWAILVTADYRLIVSEAGHLRVVQLEA